VKRRAAAAAVLSVLAGLVVLPTASAQVSSTLRVKMGDNFFEPKVASTAKGSTITWTNNGRSPHNVRSGDGKVDSGALEPGKSFSLKIDVDEVFAYYCKFHAQSTRDGMSGRITVGAGGTATDSPGGSTGGTTSGPQIRRVGAGETYKTIQSAVNAAKPGDAVLVSPGVYREQVVVRTPHLLIRGLDRNKVIIDAEFKRPTAINVQGADDVSIENMSARNATLNNFYWTDQHGYYGRYLTSYRSGDYGIFAFAAVDGVFEDSWASGSVDSAIYIGQCKPCNAVIRRVKASGSGLGYSGTNAGGNLVIEDSEWFQNFGGGITPNSLITEKNPPQDGIIIRRNYVHDNNNKNAAQDDDLYAAVFGTGIVVAGGINDIVEDNRVENHDSFGILVTPLPDVSTNDPGTSQVFLPANNTIRNNTVKNSGIADIAMSQSDAGNCYSGNTFGTSLPAAIETAWSCDLPTTPPGGDPAVAAAELSYVARATSGELSGGDWKKQPDAPIQPSMAHPERITFPTVTPGGSGGAGSGSGSGTGSGGTGGDGVVSHPRTGGTRPYLPIGVAVLTLSAAGAWGLVARRRRHAS
jgi:plastocyanin